MSLYKAGGHCEKSGSYSVPDRGIGARIAPGLGPDWMGLQPAKESAAIFSGIPVLRGDFGGGGGGVRQNVEGASGCWCCRCHEEGSEGRVI